MCYNVVHMKQGETQRHNALAEQFASEAHLLQMEEADQVIDLLATMPEAATHDAFVENERNRLRALYRRWVGIDPEHRNELREALRANSVTGAKRVKDIVDDLDRGISLS